MVNILPYLVFVGVAAQLIGIVSYIRKTIRGENKPNKMTWLMWGLAPMIATVAALSDGARWEILPVFMSGFGPLAVFFASFVNKNAYWKLERFDYLCGLFSLLALLLWAITKEPIIAIVFAIVSDTFAAVPTLIKLWKQPETETVSPFVAGVFSSLTSFTAIRTWTFSSYGFPLYLVCINIWLIAAFYHKRLFKKEYV